MEKKNFTVCDMPYEEYLKFKYKNLAKAVKAAMEANGWKEDEYELK